MLTARAVLGRTRLVSRFPMSCGEKALCPTTRRSVSDWKAPNKWNISQLCSSSSVSLSIHHQTVWSETGSLYYVIWYLSSLNFWKVRLLFAQFKIQVKSPIYKFDNDYVSVMTILCRYTELNFLKIDFIDSLSAQIVLIVIQNMLVTIDFHKGLIIQSCLYKSYLKAW